LQVLLQQFNQCKTTVLVTVIEMKQRIKTIRLRYNRLLLALPVTVLLLRCSSPAVAQDDFTNMLQQNLQQYYVDNSPLDLHLFFNQPVYAPGDTAYFKVSFLSAGSRKPVSGRTIINVDIYRQPGERIHHQKVLLRGGFGGNQFVVPATLEPGVYVVAAFNEWMLNGDESALFFATLKITNGPAFERRPRNAMSLFPEGGTFVAGIENKVAIVGVANRRVELRDGSDSTLVTASLDERGVTSVSFTPQTGQSYTVTDGQLRETLPPPSNSDIHLAVFPPEGLLMQTQLFCPEDSRRNEGYHFVIHGSAGIYYTARIGFRDSNLTTLQVPTKLLPSGLVCATLFDQNQQVIASRIFMAEQNPGVAVDLKFNNSGPYAPRDSIHATVELFDAHGQALKSVVGVTVIDASLFSGHEGSYSLKEMLLATGNVAFGGLKELPRLSLNPKIWDDVLISEQWNRYRWTDVLKGKERGSHVLKTNIHFSGTILREDRHSPVDTTIATFFLQHDIRAYEDYPKKNGAFDFALYFDFHGQEDVFYSIEEDGKRIDDARLLLNEPPVITFPESEFIATEKLDSYMRFAQRRIEIREAYQRRSIDQLVEDEKSPHHQLEDEIDGADVTINLDDYLIFPTMEETLREIIPGLYHRWRNREHTVRVRLTEPDDFPTENPIYFVDGVLTTDTDYFMALKPADVASIKVITSQQKLSTFGNLGKNGIVLVETKISGNADRVPRSKSYFKATGLTDAIQFQMVPHNKRRIPDFRASLFWTPVLYSDASGRISFSFCAADNPGRFRIIVDGIAENGEPVYAESTFEVVYKE
jgi:hypothetical protein